MAEYCFFQYQSAVISNDINFIPDSVQINQFNEI
jgi:hypothetical protein